MPEEKRLKEAPNLAMAPMLTEDVGRVNRSINEMEVNNARRNCFSYPVERKHGMPFV